MKQSYCGLCETCLIDQPDFLEAIAKVNEYLDQQAGRIVIDLVTGRSVTLGAPMCHFGYRDSVFKRDLAGKGVITRVRFRLPRPWQPVLGYLELERKMQETGNHAPDAQTVFDWVCAIRRAKLPDPAVIGNAEEGFCGDGEEITLEWALAVSCNTAFAELGMELGAAPLLEAAEAAGFNGTIPFDVDTAADLGRLRSELEILSPQALPHTRRALARHTEAIKHPISSR